MKQYTIPQSLWDVAQEYKEADQFSYPTDVSKIQVENMVAKLAFAYEKLRYAVDYKEEHLLRRNAIERITKRVLLWQQEELSNAAATLMKELIRAGYIENNYYPEAVISDVTVVIRKYVLLISHLPENTNAKEKRHVINWLIGIASVELEGILYPMQREQKLLQHLYRYLLKNLKLQNSPFDKREHEIQTFVAAHRMLLKSDHATLGYYLFIMYLPKWATASDEEVIKTASHIYDVHKNIHDHITGPLSEQLLRSVTPPAVYYSIMGDVFREHSQQLDTLLFDVKKFEGEIKKICDRRYKTARKKLRRSAINSIIYIILTKIILAFLIEVPYDLLTVGEIHHLPLVINIVFHPFLIFLIAIFTRVPSKQNTKKIIEGIHSIVYNLDQEKIIHEYKRSAEPGSRSYRTVSIVYTLLYLVTFGVILSILSRLGFNLASGFLFVFFLTIVTFFGIRIRHSARELVIVRGKENVLSFLFDLFTVPLLRVGRWISVKSSKVNIFIFIFDYIIENPFKLVVKGIESGVLYVRQKKDEVYN